MVWIRFPSLGMEYYDESLLLALATAVGTPIKVDIRTLDASRGKFARVCIEIDLDKPVVGKIWFRNFWYHVEYEGLHLLCKSCGLYGHVARNCPSKNVVTDSIPEVNVGVVNANGGTPETAAPSSSPKESSQNDATLKKDDLYGDWLVVSRKKNQGRKQRPNMQEEKTKPQGGDTNKPSFKGLSFTHLNDNNTFNAEFSNSKNGGPPFHPGGNLEMPKVLTKRNKRARGLDTKGKLTNNHVTERERPSKPNTSKPDSMLVGGVNMGRVMILGNPLPAPINHTQKQSTNETVVFLAQKTSKSKPEMHLKPPDPNDLANHDRGGVDACPADEMVVETPNSRQGFANSNSRNHVHDLARRFKPELIILVETHTPFTSSENFWHREGYEKIAVQEAQGHAGGIWAVKRRGSEFSFTPVSTMHQCVSFVVAKGNDKWLCSGIYASPISTVRPRLWDHLEELSKEHALPWLAIGDFNDILLPREQKGGVFSISKADLFASNIDRCGLIDLGAFGSKFTWLGHCRGSRFVHRRLDRGFGNHAWRLKFPEATVEHLVRKHSDHNPIFLRCSNDMGSREGRPFRFQAAWFTHNAYPLLVKNAWARDRSNIVQSLQNVANESTIFNKEVFGNIFARKKEVEARLKGIQRALEDIDSANLMRLQKELLASYEDILFQEETLWFQKSRENWIRLGSRNTAFFHAQSIIRRKRNKIHGIRLSSGDWCTDPEVMRSEALNFFKELFCTNQNVVLNNNVPYVATLEDSAAAELVKPVSKKEVFDALMSMKSYKAPGPDGFQPIFFKLFWEDIGDDLWQFVKLAFETGKYDPKICETLIVLLPKGENQSTFKDFRPISLCNVTYKLISKIIVSRLRPFLDDIISPFQNSFIPGRSTKDNAIVLQEVLHVMRKSKKKNGDMVFKLDLEKAYDRVNWTFLRDTLTKFNFPPKIISLIMFGISASSNSILWNGSKTEAFTPMRGLRQGDPLSPYLFVLCMERLGMMVSNRVSTGDWKPMQLVKNGTKISHLFFADDVLLFAKASPSQASIVKEVLDLFCSMSGLKISLGKSKFCTSGGVCRRVRDNIFTTTQIHATSRFEKYLGFKMLHGRIRKLDFVDVYDRVSTKLASWKSRLLNKPGRVVLANSVISSLPAYHMQINWLPQGMCDDLDRTVRRFIWKGTGDVGMHLVSWNKITQPRRLGGLGVRVSRLQNISLLGKLIWEILNSPDKLWVKLFEEKYLKGRLIFKASVSGGSVIWNSVAKSIQRLRDGFTIKIGDGNSNFWFDPWVFKENLGSMVPFVAIQDTSTKIKDVWYDGSWNFQNLYTIVPDFARKEIVSLQPRIVNGIPDIWVWQSSSVGIYTVKDAYNWLLEPSGINNHSNWQWIWRLTLPASIQFFIWQLAHDSIPTKAVLHHRK
ncbi:ribonuclease H, partial [Trifolium pratense]